MSVELALLFLLSTFCMGSASGREVRLERSWVYPEGRYEGAMVEEQTPDPVLSINLNPDLLGP